MVKLLNIEGIKFLGSPILRALLIIHFTLFLLVALLAAFAPINIQGVSIDKLFQFPFIWQTFAWIASWYNLLLGILAIVMVANEHQYRTYRKQLIDGLSRTELLISKLIAISIIAIYTTLLVFATGLIIGFMKTSSFNFSDFIGGLSILPILFLQSLSYMVLGMLVAFILKSTAMSIVGFVLYFFPIEPIIRAFIPAPVDKFFPFKIISNLTPMPDFFGIALGDSIHIKGVDGVEIVQPEASIWGAVVLSALLYLAAFALVSKLIIDKRNF